MTDRLETNHGAPRVPAADHTQRRLAAWSLGAAVVLLAAMAGPFLAGRIYTRDDLGATHLPLRAFYAGQLAHGEPFDWMPQIFSGFYLTGEGQAGTYHPLHWLLYRFLPLQGALAVEFLAAYPVMLAGTYFWLRRRLGRRDAAMLGSLAFTFSGFNLLHFAHPNAIAVVAHIPWLLWAIDIALLDRASRKTAFALAAVALLTGSQLLLGYPQYVWFSLVAEAAYAGYLLTVRNVEHASSVPGATDVEHVSNVLGTMESCPTWYHLAIAKACGLLLGGVQLLPTIEALSQSARHGADAAFANWGSLHPMNLIQLIAPYLLTDRVLGENTHELGIYVGAVPLMLVVWLGIRRRDLGRLRGWTLAVVVFAIVSLLLAMGDIGQIYRLQRLLPLVGSFRFPCRYLMLFYLAVSVLAAIGFLLLVEEHRSARRRRDAAEVPRSAQSHWAAFGPLWFVVILSAVVALTGLVLRDHSRAGSPWGMIAGPVLIAAAAALTVLAARGMRGALVGLVLLAAADLGIYGLSYAIYPQTYRLDRYLAQTSTPPDDPSAGRVVADLLHFDQQGRHVGNQLIVAGWRRADGYVGLEPRRQLDYSRLPALQVAGVRWVRRGATTDRIEGLLGPNSHQKHDPQWKQVPRPLPRVWLATHARQSAEPADDLGRIDIRSTALVEVPLGLPPGEPGKAEITADRPGNLHIRCNCATTQLLVISESFHTGWKATVAGKPRQVFRVDGDFMGCMVGPGEQTVVLEFRPDSLRRGWIASCFGLGLIVLCCVGMVPRRGQEPLPERPVGCFAQRFLTPFWQRPRRRP